MLLSVWRYWSREPSHYSGNPLGRWHLWRNEGTGKMIHFVYVAVPDGRSEYHVVLTQDNVLRPPTSPNDLLSSYFPIKLCDTYFFCPIRATYPNHSILLNFFCHNYMFWRLQIIMDVIFFVMNEHISITHLRCVRERFLRSNVQIKRTPYQNVFWKLLIYRTLISTERNC